MKGTATNHVAKPSVEPHQSERTTLPLSRKDKMKPILELIALKYNVHSSVLLANKPRIAFMVDARNELAYRLRQQYQWTTTIIGNMTNAKPNLVRHRIIAHCNTWGLALPDGIGKRHRSKRSRLKAKP